MNRLLSFNPEPFESDFEFENLSQVYGTTTGGSEKESELEYAGARGRNLRFRKPPRPLASAVNNVNAWVSRIYPPTRLGHKSI